MTIKDLRNAQKNSDSSNYKTGCCLKCVIHKKCYSFVRRKDCDRVGQPVYLKFSNVVIATLFRLSMRSCFAFSDKEQAEME